MNPDQVAIITPCLNPGPYLEECLGSVRRQGDIVSKHVVIDGGSTDGTVERLELAARQDPKLIWRRQESIGQAAALNEAIALVDTEYFGWLNADDCYEDMGMKRLLTRAAGEPQRRPSIVYGDYRVIDESGVIVKCRRQPTFNYFDCLYSYLTVLNAAAIFRTEDVRTIGGLDPTLQFCMDYDLILRLARGRQVLHRKEYIAQFRTHRASKSARMQQICEQETRELRVRHSGRTSKEIRFNSLIGRIRVVARMAKQGCLPCRLDFR